MNAVPEIDFTDTLPVISEKVPLFLNSTMLLRLHVTPTLISKLWSIHRTYSGPTLRVNPESPICATL